MKNAALPPRHVLSKSTFVRGCQCHKSLWLYKKHYNLRDKETTAQQRIFMQGNDVGLLARQLFGNGVDASPIDVFHYRESVRDTAQYIQQGHAVIFEAAFQHEGVLCAADVLIRHKGKWYMYEVKSSMSVKPQFVQDAALQYYVLNGAGIEVEDFFLVYINPEYVRRGALDLRQLFKRHSLKEDILQLQPLISQTALELKQVLAVNTMPAVDAGDHCLSPYRCDFFGFCHPDEQPDNTLLTIKKQLPLKLSGPATILTMVVCRSAVPAFEGHWPYRRVPVVFGSVTITSDSEDWTFEVADYNSDPCGQLLHSLLQVLQGDTPLLVTQQKMIAEVLHQLAIDFPEHNDALTNAALRLHHIECITSDIHVSGETEGDAGYVLDMETAAALWYNHQSAGGGNNTDQLKVLLREFTATQIRRMRESVSFDTFEGV